MLSEWVFTYFEIFIGVSEKRGDFVGLQGPAGEVYTLEETPGCCFGRFLVHFN